MASQDVGDDAHLHLVSSNLPRPEKDRISPISSSSREQKAVKAPLPHTTPSGRGAHATLHGPLPLDHGDILEAGVQQQLPPLPTCERAVVRAVLLVGRGQEQRARRPPPQDLQKGKRHDVDEEEKKKETPVGVVYRAHGPALGSWEDQPPAPVDAVSRIRCKPQNTRRRDCIASRTRQSRLGKWCDSA
eukprot:437168-Prorocentrum_minimum.AAC.2